jgi:caffeoyl-CoA O-methyltransferase
MTTTNKSETMSDELHAYLVAHGSTPDPVVADLIKETWAVLPKSAGMQISPEQARFLEIFTRLTGARYAVEVGTFTGLSSIAITRGMGPEGRMLCCDVSEEYTSIARRYWARAGVDDRIELRLGPGAETVRQLPADAGFDLAFVDADKPGYPTYWNELVPRMRPGGVILVDNVLRAGRVLDPQTDADRAIVAFNDLVLADERVDAMLLPLGDGMTFARRR